VAQLTLRSNELAQLRNQALLRSRFPQSTLGTVSLVVCNVEACNRAAVEILNGVLNAAYVSHTACLASYSTFQANNPQHFRGQTQPAIFVNALLESNFSLAVFELCNLAYLA